MHKVIGIPWGLPSLKKKRKENLKKKRRMSSERVDDFREGQLGQLVLKQKMYLTFITSF